MAMSDDRDQELGTQAFVHVEWPSRARFEEPSNRDPRVGIPIKPAGGLWTSSFLEDGSCAWIGSEAWEWHSSHLEGEPRLFALEPAEGLEILEIDGPRDLDRALSEWEREDLEADVSSSLSEMYALLDFEALAEEYDGIHLSGRGAATTRHSQPSLYGWDCESTLWLGWAFDEAADLGPASSGDRDE
jgi:hypothetical protein